MSAETSSGNKVVSVALSSGSESLLIALTDTLQLLSFNLKEILAESNSSAGK